MVMRVSRPSGQRIEYRVVSSVQQLNLSVLKVGDFTAGTQDTVNFILEGADNLANGDLAGHVIGDVSF